MLVPAICYREELMKKFAKEIYTDRYFYYMGYAHGHKVPEITDNDDNYQWAIVDKDDVIGYFAYKVYAAENSVERFGLYAFDDEDYSVMRNALVLGRDVYNKIKELITTYHRVSWRVISGNPVIPSYDRLCKEFKGNSVRLHDVLVDAYGNYHDEIIYEIIDDWWNY